MFGAKALIEKKVWNLILLEPSIESYVIAEKSIVYTLFWNVCILSHSSEIKGLCSTTINAKVKHSKFDIFLSFILCNFIISSNTEFSGSLWAFIRWKHKDKKKPFGISYYKNRKILKHLSRALSRAPYQPWVPTSYFWKVYYLLFHL